MAQKINFSGILTKPEGEEEAARRAQTYTGMAHFAAGGPPGATCRGCEHWLTEGWNADKGSMKGLLKDSPCAVYLRMRTGRGKPPKVPYNASACKYFEPRDQEVRMHAPPMAISR